MAISPRLLVADAAGNIFDDPDLLMVCDRAGQWALPDQRSLVPLPPESELFLLPGRRPAGFNPHSGKMEVRSYCAVAAFAAPGYTLAAHPAYIQDADAPMLPLFAYGAVGYAAGKFWICASCVDDDPRQRFARIKPALIERECRGLLKKYPTNRLIAHIINNCVRRYSCPAARNFALGRYEAPLPTATACNARCLGCISLQGLGSPIAATPQCRLAFTPTSAEIVEVMHIHAQRERKAPIYSFGQGCEGDPLTNYPLLAASIHEFRSSGGAGTVNCNSNASEPGAIAALAEAGLTSLRVSLNSAIPEHYAAYYRPHNYDFAAVVESLKTARRLGVYASLNLLYFPGLTDTESELTAITSLCRIGSVSMIQLRNLNIDPHWHLEQMGRAGGEPALGLRNFISRLKKACPWLRFGYFNPYLGTKAEITAPLPG